MNIVIIEDEERASQKLIRLLNEINKEIQVGTVIESVEGAINWFSNKPLPDLILMDVQLEDGLCFEIFENIHLTVPIIFTTAFDEYSLKAFKVNSVDYLLKPVDIHELKKAIEKFQAVHQKGIGLEKIESLLSQFQPARKERFLIKVGLHYKSVQTSDIKYFHIIERCSFITIAANESYPVDYSLDKIEKLVNPSVFFRVNRHFIINFSAIKDVTACPANRLKITLDSRYENDEIFVSRERVADFKKWMDR